MTYSELMQALWQNQDLGYREMQIRTIPNIPQETIIGVRTPILRALAKNFTEGETFLQQLPHSYFEENQLHAFLLSMEKDFCKAADGVDRFLPYVDNWATCDQMSPKVFGKYPTELLPYIEKWLGSPEPYAVRFGIKMLMDHFLDDGFSPRFPQMVAAVNREEYYIRMMVAWYFATALAKQYEAVYPYLEEKRLEKWVHNKTIQKAVESFRIPPEQKDTLRKLRIK